MQISETNSVQDKDSMDFSVVRESDFYSELKHASEQGNKDTFALILSMLTTDAIELDQFQQPHTKPVTNKTDLYKKYFVQQNELRGELSSQRSIGFNALVQQKQVQSLQLDLAINPEPLLPNTVSVIDEDVFNNLDLNARVRFTQSNEINIDINSDALEETLSKPDSDKEIDVESWFNVLEQARTLSMTA